MSEAKMYSPISAIQLEPTLRQALACHQTGKLQEAERLYHAIIGLQPNHPTANHNLGILAVQLLQPEAGLPYFRTALTANPAQEQYRISYANALLDSGQVEAALATLNAWKYSEPVSPIAQALRQKIEKALTDSGPFASRSLVSEIDKIVARFNAGYYEEVEKRAAALLFDHPGSGIAWKVLGAAQKALHKDALPAMRKAAQLLPDDVEAHFNLGVAQEDLGLLVDAESSYRKALSIKPDFAKAHYNLGLTLSDLGRLEEAIQSYRQALLIQQDFADVYNNLGATLAELGKLDEAVATYRKGLELRPDFAEAHNNLGNLLTSQDKYEDAIASYREAIRIKPDFVEALRNLANTLAAAGNFAEAVANYRQVLSFQPDDPEIHNSIGCALKDIGRHDEIVSCFRKSLELDASYAEAHVNLAMAVKNLDRREAEHHCRRALEISPDLTSALLFSAEIHSDKGQFGDAEKALRKIIAKEPDSPYAWAQLAGLRKMSIEDREWLENAERIACSELSPRVEAPLRFALGKYYDDVKNFDQAFANYRRANQLQQSIEVKYGRHKQVETVNTAIKHYSNAWLSQVRSYANPSKRPIFIVGMPRSGTSLSEQILASHPDVYGAGELMFWNFAGLANPVTELTSDNAQPLLAKLGDEYLEVLRGFSVDAQHVVDKMPTNFVHLGLLQAIYPNCRVIHMQRNPVDTCLSIYFQNFNSTHAYAYDLDDLAHCYQEYLRLMAHWRKTLPEGAMLEVPYEALIQDQEGWTRKMLDFIGLPWNDSCLEFDKSERIVGTVSNWQVRQKITATSVERWRNYEKYVGPLLGLLESAAGDAQ